MNNKDVELIKTGFMDYLSTNGHNLDKEKLIEMLKEFYYAVYSTDKEVAEKAVDVMLEEVDYLWVKED